jgi:HSP20 family protein
MERSLGSFTRVLLIPKDVDTEKAEASFKKGVLTITMPKLEKGKQARKKIQIKSG